MKRLSNTQGGTLGKQTCRMINSSLQLVIMAQVYRCVSWASEFQLSILLPSQKSINWNLQLKCSLGFWAFICLAPWTPPRDDSIIISLSGFCLLEHLRLIQYFTRTEHCLPDIINLAFLTQHKHGINQRGKGN